MNFSFKYWAGLFGAAIMVVNAQTLVLGQTNAGATPAPVPAGTIPAKTEPTKPLRDFYDALAALPEETEFKNFLNFDWTAFPEIFYGKPSLPRATVFATRSDAVDMRIEYTVYPSATESEKDFLNLWVSSYSMPPEYLPHRRDLGQRYWLSQERDYLIVRDGRVSIVAKFITPPLRIDEQGRFLTLERRPVTSSDLFFVEGVVSQMLDRFTALGYTSKAPETASARTRHDLPRRLAIARERGKGMRKMQVEDAKQHEINERKRRSLEQIEAEKTP